MSTKKYITLENLQTYRQEDKAELDAALLLKQDALVSGTNIKTVNGNSLLGSGDLDVTPDVIADLPLTAAEATSLLTAIGGNLNASIQLSNWSGLTDLSATAAIRLHDADDNLIFYFTRSIGMGGNEPMQMWLCYTSVDNVSLFATITNGLLQLGQLEVLALPGDPYDPTQTYSPGDFVRGDNGHLLRCAFATTSTFNADDWVDYTEVYGKGEITHAYAIDVLNAYVSTSVAPRYVEGTAYHVGDLVSFTAENGILMRCVRDTVAPHDFDISDWQIVSIKTLLSEIDSAKQNALVSGTNIKTVNGNSVLGSGNIDTTPTAATIADIRTLFGLFTKGDIIRFDALGDGTQKRFRIIDVDNDNTVKLLGLDDLGNSAYNASSRIIAFDNGSSYQNYESSNLDTYLNTTYYNSLSSAVKSAIVDEILVQNCYGTSGAQSSSADFNVLASNGITYAYTKITQRTVGSRHIHAIELDEIKSYFGANTGDVINYTNLLDTFFEQTTTLSKNIWCASASADNSGFAFRVVGSVGIFYNSDTTNVVRPVFKIDLTNIQYTKED